VREALGGSAVGATMQNLNQSILLNLSVALPPVAEQRRIVAKIGELMEMCDEFEAALNATETQRVRLLRVLVGGHEKCTEMGTKSAQVSGVSQP
jgi:type I restriction enzyme S subunit